jgi:hypothetical protein
MNPSVSKKDGLYWYVVAKKPKTYNSGYSLVVTHLTTNPPVRCLNRAERTGSLVVSCPVVTNVHKFTVSGKQ